MDNASQVRFGPILPAVADFARPDAARPGLAVIEEYIHLPPAAPETPS